MKMKIGRLPRLWSSPYVKRPAAVGKVPAKKICGLWKFTSNSVRTRKLLKITFRV